MDLMSGSAALAFAAWLYLVLAHGRFWLGDQRLDGRAPRPRAGPTWWRWCRRATRRISCRARSRRCSARSTRGASASCWSTTRAATAPPRPRATPPRLTRAASGSQVVATAPRPSGWVGKMWAVETGVRAASAEPPDWWWLTDADVEHAPDTLARLVAKGEAERLDLVSLMVRLDPGRGWNALLVPAFVYFFQQLYPFPRVNDPRARTAAAAGGCVVVRSDALARAGGIAALRGEVIDDCALGRAVKRGGPIWLGLAEREASVRPYQGLGDVWNMVARSAYTQLRHSPLLLAGTLAGLALLYLVPVLALLAWPLHRRLSERRARRRRLGAAGRVVPAHARALPALALAGARAARGRRALRRDDLRLGAPPLARARRDLEGPRRRRRELGAR